MRWLLFSFCLLFLACEKERKKEPVIEKPKEVVVPKKRKPAPFVKNHNLNATNVVEFFTKYGEENKETKVVLETRLGEIVIKLYEDTPLHRANFIFLVKEGYFDTTCFHRIVPGFIAQAGNSENRSTVFFKNMYRNYLLPAEFRKNRKHKRGAVAQARLWEDNPEKKSDSFEFYIIENRRGEHHLDGEHTVFGEVIKGMNVVDQITKLKAGKDEWPYSDVHIKTKVIE